MVPPVNRHPQFHCEKRTSFREDCRPSGSCQDGPSNKVMRSGVGVFLRRAGSAGAAMSRGTGTLDRDPWGSTGETGLPQDGSRGIYNAHPIATRQHHRSPWSMECRLRGVPLLGMVKVSRTIRGTEIPPKNTGAIARRSFLYIYIYIYVIRNL